MSSLAIAGVVFACILAGTLFGMLITRFLPAHHLSGESKDAVKQGLALIATLTALVLGLLVATTKGTFDAQSTAVREMAANIALLDRILDRYGPDTKEIRASLPAGVRILVEQMWPEDGGRPAHVTAVEMRAAWEAIFDKVAALEAKTDVERLLKARAIETIVSLAQRNPQKMLAQKESSIPVPFLLVLGFWLTVLFVCYALLAPRNLTVFAVLVVCMLSVAGALFLVLEMDRPFDGIVRVSSAPLLDVVARLGS